MACLISTGSSQKICCSCTAAMFHAMKNNLFFPYRLLRSSVRLTLSFITRIMTILYILHKKKRLYGLDEKQIIKYLFYKISLDTAQMNTHRFKISPCAFADRSPDVKLFVFFCCWDGCDLNWSCESWSMSYCPPEVFGRAKLTLLFSFLLLFMCVS